MYTREYTSNVPTVEPLFSASYVDTWGILVDLSSEFQIGA